MRMFTFLFVLVALVAASSAGAAPKDKTLHEYASDTWHSFDMMLYPQTGLPADNVSAAGERARYTSPTNIGAYLWSTIAARDLGLITPAEAVARIDKTLNTLATLDRHTASGQFFNWYDPATGERLTTWPADGSTVYPFLSTVDNAWLAMALAMVANAVPQEAAKARALYEPMDFGFYY